MQALHDPSRKTSINSLLNPQDSSAFPVPLTPLHPSSADVNQSHSHLHSSIHSGHVFPPSDGTFSLRTATWGESDTRASNTIPRHHSYHHHQQMQMTHQMSNAFADHHAPRPPMRSDWHDRYVENGHRWLHQQHDTNTGVFGHPYSDERSVQSCDYRRPQHNLSSNHPEHSTLSNSQIPPVWQQSERASVRLAARETASASPQDFPYPPSPPFIPQQVNDLPPQPSQESYPPQQEQSTTAVSTISRVDSGSSTGAPSNKRPLPEPEAAPAPKAKRAKDKFKVTTPGTQEASMTSTGTSRRGYNAKKRQEVASITAQNANAYQKVQTPGKRGLSATIVSKDGGKMTLTLIPELQFARCMSNRYKNEEFTRCVSCTRRWAGDTCRFQGIRYLMRDQDMQLKGVSFAPTTNAENSSMKFSHQWNRHFEREHVQRSKLSIAKALLPTLKIEQEHIQATELIRRPRETDVRATCDTCMTSLFSTSFMCRLCGREVCNECFQTVKDLTSCGEVAAAELAAVTKMREKHAHANPFFLSCLKRAEHGHQDFTPVTRFVKGELDGAIEEMQSILDKEAELEGDARCDPEPSQKTLCYDDVIKDPALPFPEPLTSPIFDDFTPSNTPEHVTSIPIHRAQIIPASYYDPPSVDSPSNTRPSFASLWKRGLPLLVKDVLPRFKLDWSPAYFVDKYGDQSCLIVECQMDTNKKVSVKEFFDWFGKYEGRKECWKLKDWPPTSEFKGAFPELYDDFSTAVPVPDYVRRDGVYNIGSHFPTNALGPDLGPKMYNSMASSQEAGSKGSTRLHMDMADAFNVMLNATACKDGTPGYAIWDLFRADDSDKIRAFLRKKFGPGSAAMNATANGQSQTQAEKAAALQIQAIAAHDPIHSQHFYLDVELRRQLWEEYGVKSFRIYQRPGEGVFIPAGCAHQVANMADCMKVAIDFVSPENIDRCEKLTKEFREQNQRKAWKEDVLQLRTMMWFAWLSCSSKEAEINKDHTSLGGQVLAMDSVEGSDGGGGGTQVVVAEPRT